MIEELFYKILTYSFLLPALISLIVISRTKSKTVLYARANSCFSESFFCDNSDNAFKTQTVDADDDPKPNCEENSDLVAIFNPKLSS